MKIRVPLCRHLKTNGTQCQSPALEFKSYCYFHNRLHERHQLYRIRQIPEETLYGGFDVKLHSIEDAESIQLAISVVVNAIATGCLRIERATAILYGLQLASANLKNLAPRPKPEEVVREISTTPDGLDLSNLSAYAYLTPSSEAAAQIQKECDFAKRHGLPLSPNILLSESVPDTPQLPE